MRAHAIRSRSATESLKEQVRRGSESTLDAGWLGSGMEHSITKLFFHGDIDRTICPYLLIYAHTDTPLQGTRTTSWEAPQGITTCFARRLCCLYSSLRRRSELNELTHWSVFDGRVRILDAVADVLRVYSPYVFHLLLVVLIEAYLVRCRRAVVEPVTEKSPHKRKVSDSISLSDCSYASHALFMFLRYYLVRRPCTTRIYSYRSLLLTASLARELDHHSMTDPHASK